MVGQTRYYNLDVQDVADPSRVMSQEQYKVMVHGPQAFPSPAFPQDSPRVFCFGEEVRYLSRSTGQWIPAVVEGHVMIGQELHYQLDVQEAAHPSRIKPADPEMAPTVPVLSEPMELGELQKSTASAAPAALEQSAATAAACVGERQCITEELLEDSVPLRIASPAPRPKAIASQQSLRSKEVLEAEDKDAKEQDMKAVLERVDRPSDLFNQKTFLDEPNITLSSPIFGDMLSLSLSLPVGPAQQVDAAECEVARERVSDLFSRKTFLDEPHFGLATCDSIEDGSPGQKESTGARMHV
eukprot:Skav211311  [mRNA]  locus=scaffold3605:59806:60699:+ [translate_table: standard]